MLRKMKSMKNAKKEEYRYLLPKKNQYEKKAEEMNWLDEYKLNLVAEEKESVR